MGEGLIERLDKKKEADLFESTSSLFVSATGGTFDSDIPGTFESATPGTFESAVVLIGSSNRQPPAARYSIIILRILLNYYTTSNTPPQSNECRLLSSRVVIALPLRIGNTSPDRVGLFLLRWRQ